MDELHSSVWSTEGVPPSEQFAYWREMICQSFVSLTPIPTPAQAGPGVSPSGFLGAVEQRALGSVSRSHIHAPAQQTRRTQRDVSRDDGEFYFLNLQLTGECRVDHNGQQVLLTPGKYAILDTRLPYVLDFPDEWSMYSYRIPAAWLDRYRPQGMSPVAPREQGAVHELLAGAVRGLWEVNGAAADGALAQSLSSLIAATWAEPVSESGNALLRRRALDYMSSELSRPGLSVASIAAELHVSIRALHSAFEGRRMTVAETLRHMRMERAEALLRKGACTVAEVGQAVGYAQPSSFSRAFKAATGYAPNEIAAERQGVR